MKRMKYKDGFFSKAHKASIYHREEILNSKLCGCFSCCNTFTTDKIEDWIESEGTALCPICGIDSVLSDKYPIGDQQFLREMNRMYF